MKKVTLLGDSIRHSYQPVVAREHAGIADVWGPDENCMHSLHHVFNMEWYLDYPTDLVHFNFGLWDCLRLNRETGGTAIPLDLSARNLQIVLDRTSSLTCQRVWATITPIVQASFDRHFAETSDFFRIAEDYQNYNKVPEPILRVHRITINDLHPFIREQGVTRIIRDDGVDLNPSG